MKQTTKLINLFLFPAIVMYLWLIVSCSNDGNSFCDKLSFFWFVFILFLLASIYVALAMNGEDFFSKIKKVFKFSGLFFILGVVLTLITWPVTYFDYYIPCRDGTINCIEGETVGYLSFTSNGAIEKFVSMQNKFSDDYAVVISRGSPWPGLGNYYSYLLLRGKEDGSFYIKSSAFKAETFFEFSFEYGFLIEVLLIIFYVIKKYIIKKTKKVSSIYNT